MNGGATAAQSLWLASNLPESIRFAQALRNPELAQTLWLRKALRREATSRFGQEHQFAGFTDYRSFARHVPLSDYCDVDPWIQCVRAGEQNGLTTDRVTHLVPTSGTSGARKLIPFTAVLQRGFSAAVGAWMCDLARRRPGLVFGPGYWAVSPLSTRGAEADEASAVPIGFADDADYLGGFSAWLVRQALAVPNFLRHVHEVEPWRAATLLCLLRQPDLRLISIWHPSYLELLTGGAATIWSTLCEAIKTGEDPWLGKLQRAPAPRRARELARIGPSAPRSWWPRLQVISCWGEQAAEPGWRQLRRDFPDVLIQPKGLLATEAVVTFPWRGVTPLAITSHFFEFIDEAGDIRRAHELCSSRSYEVVVSNGGGLWRYRLGDRVECTGHLAATPLLRFLGRNGNVSDLRGEKLSEPFVARALAGLWPENERPAVGELYAKTAYTGEIEEAWYELHVSSALSSGLAERIEAALGENPHYAWARRLGQLGPVKIVCVSAEPERQFGENRRGLAERKPRVLVKASADST